MPAVLNPNLGLFLNRPLISIPEGALADGHNFRVKNGALSNLNLGWERFSSFTLNGPVTLIDGFFDRNSSQILIFGTPSDLYRYLEAGGGSVVYITPVFTTGTVNVSGTTVTAASGTPNWLTNGIVPGQWIFIGSTTQNSTTAAWHQITAVTNTTLTLATSPGSATGAVYTIRRTFSGTIDTPWETATFLHEGVADEDLWIATNGVDNIVTWNGTDLFAKVAGLGFKAFHLGTHKNMLLASAITEGGEFFPAQVRNSRPGFPLDFSTGLASAFTAHGGSDEVSALLPLGDSVIMYAERHIVVADFVGDPFIFVLRDAVPNLGPLSGRLVGDFGDNHAFLGPDAGYEFDGVNLSEVGSQVWREVLRRRDPTRLLQAFSHFDEENGDLIWAVPLTDDEGSVGPETAWVEHYLEETDGDISPVSKRSFPFTATGFFERQSSLTWVDIVDRWKDLNFRWNDIFFSAAFPFNLGGTAAGQVFTLNTIQTADGALLPSFVRTGRRALTDGRHRDMISRVYPFASQADGTTLAVRVRRAEHAAGPVSTFDEQPMDLSLPEEGHFTSHFRVARFYELEFATDGSPWRLAGWDVDVRRGGAR